MAAKDDSRPSDRASAEVLVVDDDPELVQMLQVALKHAGYLVLTASGYAEAADAINRSKYPLPVVVTDLAMRGGSGLDVLAAAKQRDPTTEVILVTAHASLENALEAMRAGAFDFVTKPFSPKELVSLLEKALSRRAMELENNQLRKRIVYHDAQELVGHSPAMRAVLRLVERVSKTNATVLITGESGTGKEVIARAIHRRSNRSDKPMLVVNCGALPPELMESELFGHEKGAFTGATNKHLGVFGAADGGTVLLDEVGELPLSVQSKLLRVLNSRHVRPIGAAAEIPVDVRVFAATNRDIEADVAKGRFRQDLYYRLNVMRIEVPALRDRREDIPLFIERMIANISKEIGKDIVAMTPEAIRVLMGYAFPGNVRELKNVIERAVTLSGARTIGVGDLPSEICPPAPVAFSGPLSLPDEGCRLDNVIDSVERRLLVDALKRTGGRRKQTAKLLGITTRSLRYRLEKHGLDVYENKKTK
ncbi:MAG: sigma-54-dependent Fis family transcriptional regulator [Deltaproteobacteria bacterium]|nr:sigma-54-dependent Fis family transcriptional regulator [Deltaproteobacteria bacterium]